MSNPPPPPQDSPPQPTATTDQEEATMLRLEAALIARITATTLGPDRPPTVKILTDILAGYFPLRPRDVPFLHHAPRSPWFSAHTAPVDRMILSITPTEGVYSAINSRSRVPPLVFLHRPFGLERARVRRGVTVLSCHVGFDEVLTVGWNVVLATRLGMDVEGAVCVKGYKGDAERRIGIVGRVKTTARVLVVEVGAQFGGLEGCFGVDEGGAEEIEVLAIMNAFHAEEVERVMVAAFEKGWIENPDDGRKVLYLTGAVREPGLEAARAKGIKVVCVGHRACEEWGIRYLASEMRTIFPLMQVQEIFEDEPPRPPKEPKVKKDLPVAELDTAERGGVPI